MRKKLLFFVVGIFATGSLAENSNSAVTPAYAAESPRLADVFSGDIANLPEIKPTEIVSLKDGESFELRAYPIKQKINGTWLRRLSYNGMIPGPTLRVTQGTRVKVTVRNELAIETTLHPHGLKVPNKYDGVPGVGQPPIKPGGSYLYELNFDDEGLFWYHPHIRDDYSIDAGLLGLILVDPKKGSELTKPNHEFFLVLDDLGNTLIDRQYYVHKSTHTLMGRFGGQALINGRTVDENPARLVSSGQSARFFVLNSANTRTFRIAVDKHRLKLVGSDGGLFEKEEETSAISLGPGERYIFDVNFEKLGTFSIRNDKPVDPWVLAKIEVKKGPAKVRSKEKQKTAATEDRSAVRAFASKASDFEMKLSMTMDHHSLPMEKSHHMAKKVTKSRDKSEQTFYFRGRLSGVEWDDDMASMNAKSDNHNISWKIIDTKDGKENMAINWTMMKNRMYKIRIVNDARSMHPMQHPIHFHGNSFAVLSVNEKPNPNLVWKDTVLVGAGDVVDIIMNATNPGIWMGHCHILEHIEAHMMMGFTVSP